MQPFSGLRVLDLTHVLAGPFATYQLGVLGAEVIKIEHPVESDQARGVGRDRALKDRRMGSSFQTQASNKKALALDIKTVEGQEILRRLAASADVMVENYRPGALDALGLGYEDLSAINPRLIYCSMSAFGSTGPRRTHTAYDYVIQAASGIMAMTGTPETNPVKIGTPAVDYATGTTGAFALASALFQRERTGTGQRIDMSMYDVAMILMGSHVTEHLHTGHEPGPKGNRNEFATNSCYETADGLLMLGASNPRQAERLWRVLERTDMIQPTIAARAEAFDVESRVLGEILKDRSARDWEEFFQDRHVPAARVRGLAEALEDSQLAHRSVVHNPDPGPAGEAALSVPIAAFRFAHGGPEISTPPPEVGRDTQVILTSLGYNASEIDAMEKAGAVYQSKSTET
jgi:crotonobetainyl-CoA:carnitine CoA-transferase CaiB-like acyl-CoA transferase